MTEFELGHFVAATSILALVIFLVDCICRWVAPPIEKIIEALGFGAGVGIGLRMIVAAFHAQMLCCISDGKGKTVRGEDLPALLGAGMHLTFDEHAWEVAAGGVAIIAGSIYSMYWLCLRPSHHLPTGSPTHS